MTNLASPIVAMLAAGAAEQAYAHPVAVGETLAQTMSHQFFAPHHLPAVLVVACVLYLVVHMRQGRRSQRRRDL